MEHDQTTKFARILDEAQQNAEPVEMISADASDLTLEEAYQVQIALTDRRLSRGETLVGMKMGLTSKAKMEQVGVHSPIYGHLTSGMKLADGATLSTEHSIHPRVEPEVCFILGSDLHGPTTGSDALAAVDRVCAALEVIDSRFRDFEFTIEDVVADNASSSKFVLGNERVRPDEVDLGNIGMILNHNGEVAETGSSAAILEHPVRSLVSLVNSLAAEHGEYLEAGDLVLSGGATSAIHVEAGDHVLLEADGLGTVELNVE